MLEWISAISSIVGALTTIGILILAWYQLRDLLRSNSIHLVLELEGELNSRKVRIDEVSLKLREISQSGNIAHLEIFEDDLEAAIDTYLNALDRLAFCILRGYLSERHWQQEYRDLIIDTIRNNKSKFGTGTYYRNIEKLNQKWQGI